MASMGCGAGLGIWETSKLVIGCGDAERGGCEVRSPVDGDAGVMPRRVSYPTCCFVLSRSGHPGVHGGEPRAAERVVQYHPWRPRGRVLLWLRGCRGWARAMGRR
uniref:Uncharacterized protein n=1 Tax=Oryza barthii TaxID=65489 RepID=A0A0D3FGW9_9ORYZ